MLPSPCLPTTLTCCLRITISFCWRGSVMGSKKREHIINSMMPILSCSWVRSEESGEVLAVGKRFSHKAAFCQRRNQEIVPLLQSHRARCASNSRHFVSLFCGGVVAPPLSSSCTQKRITQSWNVCTLGGKTLQVGRLKGGMRPSGSRVKGLFPFVFSL